MSRHRTLVAGIALGLTATGLSLLSSAAEAAPDPRCVRTNDTVAKLTQCVTLDGVLEHEQALQDIANAHNGNRASGTPGYAASLAYVRTKLIQAGYSVTTQDFEFFKYAELGPSAFQQTAPGTVTYTQGTDFGVTPQSDPGDVTAAVTAVDIQLGLGNTSSSGARLGTSRGSPPATSLCCSAARARSS